MLFIKDQNVYFTKFYDNLTGIMGPEYEFFLISDHNEKKEKKDRVQTPAP